LNSFQFLIFSQNTEKSIFAFEVNNEDLKIKTNLEYDLKGNYNFLINLYRNNKQIINLEAKEVILLQKYESYLQNKLKNRSGKKLLMSLKNLFYIIKFLFNNSEAIQICFRNFSSYTINTNSFGIEGFLTTEIKDNSITNFISHSLQQENVVYFNSFHKVHVSFVHEIRSFINKNIFTSIIDSLNFLTFIIPIIGFVLDMGYYILFGTSYNIFNEVVVFIIIPAMTVGLTLLIRKLFFNSIVNKINRLLK
jgi:hypothetical protein